MTVGSGLVAQLGAAEEVTVGTIVTPAKFWEFTKAGFRSDPTWLEGSGLRVGKKYKRASRFDKARDSARGELELEHATKGMGLLWKHALGSAAVPTQIATSGAYEQYHQPGDHQAKGLTFQTGIPEPSGTVRAFTYPGCKITGWEFTISDNAKAMLALTVDGWREDDATALAVASYPVGVGVFTFKDSNLFTLGGTVSTTSGKMSVASGTPVTAVVNSFTLRGESPHKTDRYGLGNAGIKKEQVENDIPTVTGQLAAEFAKTELYDVFKNNTATPLQLRFQRGDAGGANPFELGFILPAVKFKAAPVPVEGPDVVAMTVDFEAYDDDTNGVLEVKLVSTDVAL